MKPSQVIPHCLPGLRLGNQLSPGHLISAKCDGCRRWLSTTEGCTRYRGVLLHCRECTAEREDRKAGRFEAHVRLFREFVLTLRAVYSEERHDGHVQERKAMRAKHAASRAWSEDEVQVLISHYGVSCARDFKALLPGRSVDAIRKKAHELGVRGVCTDWTEAELQVLRDFYETEGPDACLARLPGRNTKGVLRHAERMNLVSPRTWREHEDELIRTRYPIEGAKACARLLPNRTHAAVQKRARDLKVRAPDQGWTEQELQTLRDNYPLHGGSYCERLLPRRTRQAVMSMAGHLKLSAPTVPTVRDVFRGIVSLDVLKARCEVHECGCWEWHGMKGWGKPRVWLPAGVAGLEKGKVMNGQMAALLLAGRPLRPGRFPVSDCLIDDCMNPEHIKGVTRQQRVSRAVKAGAYKTPSKMASQRRNGQKLRSTTPEQERAILAAEGSITEVAKALGFSRAVVHRVRRTAAAAQVLPAASVFALAAMGGAA